MDYMRKAVNSVMKTLTKEERKLVIRSAIAFKKNIKKGKRFYKLGVFCMEPTKPVYNKLLCYKNKKRKYDYIYNKNEYVRSGYVDDCFWGGKIVVLEKTLADKIYSAINKIYNESFEWKKDSASF